MSGRARAWTWLVAASVAAAVLAKGRSRRRARPPVPPGGLDILHLAFEDHRRPGSGGGGVRTHEINRRLASRHRITVVTTRYRGARRRVEDGVLYRPLGLPLGYYGSVISYHLCIPIMVRLTRSDLVVEDFAAPMSSVLVPLWTSRPTVAVVQWLFAAETSRRYRLPFHVVERWGVRLHYHFIAASRYMAEEVTALNPRVHVDVVYAGVDAVYAGVDSVHAGVDSVQAGADHMERPGSESRSRACRRRDPETILYLGRLQSGAKGLDLLLGALARLAEKHPDVRLTIAGDGPDRSEVEDLAHTLGVSERVTFAGRVVGEAKWDLLSTATIVAVPSRFESFGLVVLESFAAGTPVVAFDLPSMRELITPECGLLVPAFDVAALVEALTTLLEDPAEVERMGVAAQARASTFRWEDAAAAQEQSYLTAVRNRRARPRPPGRPDPGAGAGPTWSSGGYRGDT